MNIPTPAQVASARTARLVREAKTPVYTSESHPVERQHEMAVEIESTWGRQWFFMPDSEVDAFIDEHDKENEMWLSDVDHSAKCWCQR